MRHPRQSLPPSLTWHTDPFLLDTELIVRVSRSRLPRQRHCAFRYLLVRSRHAARSDTGTWAHRTADHSRSLIPHLLLRRPRPRVLEQGPTPVVLRTRGRHYRGIPSATLSVSFSIHPPSDHTSEPARLAAWKLAGAPDNSDLYDLGSTFLKLPRQNLNLLEPDWLIFHCFLM